VRIRSQEAMTDFANAQRLRWDASLATAAD